MTLDETFEFGSVEKVHGLKGELMLILDVQEPSSYTKVKQVFVDNAGQLVPFNIERWRITKDRAIAKFVGLENPEQVMKLKGRKVFLPLDQLPKLKDDQYYFHELIGFMVSDAIEGELGIVGRYYNTGHQDFLGVDTSFGELLIPINDAFIPKVDKVSRIVQTNLPDGFVALYREEAAQDEN